MQNGALCPASRGCVRRSFSAGRADCGGRDASTGPWVLLFVADGTVLSFVGGPLKPPQVRVGSRHSRLSCGHEQHHCRALSLKDFRPPVLTGESSLPPFLAAQQSPAMTPSDLGCPRKSCCRSPSCSREREPPLDPRRQRRCSSTSSTTT